MSGLGRCWALVVACLLIASACSVAFPVDEYEGPAGPLSCDECGGPDCQCVAGAPAGWALARVRLGAGSGDACPVGFGSSLVLGQGLKDSPCECRCGSPAPGAACGVGLHDLGQCAGGATQTVTTTACSPLDSATSARAVVASGPPCTISAKAELEFDVRVLACLDGTSGSDPVCGAGATCSRVALAPFHPAACVVRTDGSSGPCPSGYSHRYVFESDFVDTRSCTSADCGCTPQPCEGASFVLCKDAGCTDCPVTSDGKCASFGGLSSVRIIAPGKTVGSCTPTGTTDTTGSVTTTGSRVVCCTQKLTSSAG